MTNRGSLKLFRGRDGEVGQDEGDSRDGGVRQDEGDSIEGEGCPLEAIPLKGRESPTWWRRRCSSFLSFRIER